VEERRFNPIYAVAMSATKSTLAIKTTWHESKVLSTSNSAGIQETGVAVGVGEVELLYPYFD
jgi:hypothetical protein